MKRILSVTLATILLIGISALAYGGNAKGDVTGKSMNDHFEFNVHETDTSAYLGTGHVNYSRPDKFDYKFEVKYVRVAPEEHVTWFAGHVIDSQYGQNLGRWMTFVFCDQDNEKCPTDMQAGQWIPDLDMSAEEQEEIALDWVQNGFPDPYAGTTPVIKGNLIVNFEE